MSVEKSKEIIQKINTLLEGKLSLLEKDILKNEIRLLYEQVENIPTVKATFTDIHSNIATKETKKENPESIIESVIEPIIEEPVTIVQEVIATQNLMNIKQMIDLNKSFIFQQELFGNDNATYNKFIEELNSFHSEKESVDFLQKTASEKNWDKEEHVFQLMNRVVEKRFNPVAL